MKNYQQINSYMYISYSILYKELKYIMSINLAEYFAKFLIFYPLTDKKYKVYKKLETKNKFNFLIKHLLSESRKNKLDNMLNIYEDIYFRYNYYKRIVKSDDKELKINKDIIFLTRVYGNEKNNILIKNVMTDVTIRLIEANFKKRDFLLKNIDYIQKVFNKIKLRRNLK